MNNLRRRPNNSILLLLLHHLIQNRHDPILKFTIIIIRNQQIPNSVQPLLSEIVPSQIKFAQVRWTKTFDNVFFYTSGGSDYDVYEGVLGEETDVFADAGGD